MAMTRKSMAQTAAAKQGTHIQAPQQQAMANDARVVVGSERHKFFKRPVVAYMDAIPANVVVAAEDTAQDNEQTEEVAEEATKSCGIQTVYRDGEVQTEPYTADYIISPDQPEPEVLALAHLTFGNGLPGSLEEVELVQKLRERRAFEASIPTGTDEESLRVRARMLEERELRDWEDREKQMQKEQSDKLAALRDMLEAREEHVDLINEAHIAKIKGRAAAQRDTVASQVHRERLKAKRAIDRAHVPSTRGQPRDVIAQAADVTSAVYAPLVRDGTVPVVNEVVDYGIPLLDNYQGLVALEKVMRVPPPRATHAPSLEQLAPKDRETQKRYQDLDFVHNVLTKSEAARQKPVNIYKRFEPVVRPATPVIAKPADAEVSRAVEYLQRIIHGRAVQLAMTRSKDRASALIKELSDTVDAEDDADAEAARAQEEVDAAAEAVDSIAGVVVTEALDFLTKEVVRVAEERKIAEFVDRARESRRARERAESGRRQVEYLLRKKREHALELVAEVHAETASRVVDELLGAAVDEAADAQGRAYADSKMAEEAAATADARSREATAPAEEPILGVLRAVAVDPVTGEALPGVTPAQVEEAESVVRALLVDLIVPEVERQRGKRHAEVSDRKHVAAAHDALAAVVADVHRALNKEPRLSAAVAGPRKAG
jgi:hypothetical protein